MTYYDMPTNPPQCIFCWQDYYRWQAFLYPKSTFSSYHEEQNQLRAVQTATPLDYRTSTTTAPREWSTNLSSTTRPAPSYQQGPSNEERLRREYALASDYQQREVARSSSGFRTWVVGILGSMFEKVATGFLRSLWTGVTGTPPFF